MLRYSRSKKNDPKSSFRKRKTLGVLPEVAPYFPLDCHSIDKTGYARVEGHELKANELSCSTSDDVSHSGTDEARLI